MNPTRRLALFALILGCCLGGRPAVCLAQAAFPPSNFDPRYATWDTTMVRDTLGLTFERLFPIADSLRRRPEELKLLSATWRWSLGRLVKMADSMDVPIDSVGPIIDRERFNPLANVTTRTSMTYVSRYSPSASGDDWSNSLDHNFAHGSLISTSHVDIDQRQNGRGGTNGRAESRTATSNVSWRFSPRFSLGTNLASSRNDNLSPSGLYGRADRSNALGLAANSRPPAWRGFSPTLSANLDLNSVDQLGFQKRGWRMYSQGSLQYSTPWISHSLSLKGSSSDFSASPTDPNPLDEISYPNARTRESESHLAGTLTALRGKPVEVNVNYQIDNTRIHSLTAVNDTSLQFVGASPETSIVPHTSSPLNRNASSSINAQVRIQPVTFGNVDLGWKTGSSSSENTTLITGNNSGKNQAITAATRLDLRGGITMQGNFTSSSNDVRYPKRDFPRGGYGQNQHTHDLGGSVTIPVGALLTMSLETDIQLISLRYSRLGSPLTVPVANDNASQYYRITISPPPIKQRMSNTIGLKVTRNQLVNLPGASTAANTNGRSYLATWSWSYLLLPGLSANQTNSLLADYTSFPFSPTSNNVSLNYTTITTIDANVGPRCTIHTTHTSQFQPKGNYRPRVPDDPTEYLSLSDEFQNYSLDMNINYSVLPPFLTLTAHPSYSANTRNTAQSGVLSPQRKSKSLNFGWGTSVNIPVGAKGTLRGDLSRTENSSRAIEYDASGAHLRPRSATEALIGNLTFQLTF